MANLMKTSRYRREGFTLVEMLMVVTAVGVLVTMGYSYMISARPHAQLESAELQLQGVLEEARSIAIGQEIATRVVFVEGEDEFRLEVLNPNTGSFGQVGPTHQLVDNVSFAVGGVTLPSAIARFTPRGTLMAGGAVTIENSNGETATLTASIVSGRFRLGQGNLR